MFASEDKRLELELTIDERESLSTFKRRAKEVHTFDSFSFQF
jgi:hypothetical protein